MAFKNVDTQLKERLNSLDKWYYYINFDGIEVRKDLKNDTTNGYSNWQTYVKHCIPDLKGKRVLDVGCNAGIYALEMAKLGAKEIIGLDLNIEQALFVKEFFSKKWGMALENVRFIQRDVTQYGFEDLGSFDFVSLFCVIYHFKERVDFVVDEISKVTNTLVVQGNLPRLDSYKYKDRVGTEYAGVEGIKDVLKRHGFNKIQIFSIDNYPKPIAIGQK